jgi:3-polyprenyl-4-hydroxybenzoate decarboxylase
MVEISSLITAVSVLFNLFITFKNHYKLVEVQEQTNGLSANLVKLTGTSAYARGLKKGEHAKDIRRK